MFTSALLYTVVTACYIYLLAVFAGLLAMLIASALEHRHLLGQTGADDDEMLAVSPFTIPVSVIAPVYDEAVIVESAVRSLLALNYPNVEIIVVNDGSRDDTLDVLHHAFDLERRQTLYRGQLPSQPVHAVYGSRTLGNLIVVDKENGGKADALNAGLNLARFRYICAVDGDTVYHPDALLRSMRPVMRDPASIVGVTSALTISSLPEHEDGPRALASHDHLFTRFQMLDYLRAFLTSRLGWTHGNFMLCASGAFSIWRRDILVEADGFSREFSCEDIECTFRIHERLRRMKQRYRIIALPQSVGRTEGPDTIGGLVAQRARWQRAIIETVWHYRRMLFNPRYGSVGWAGMPLYLVVEVLAPLFEIVSIVVLPAAWLFGVFDWRSFLLLLAIIALTNSMFITAAVLISERTEHTHPLSDLLRLTSIGLADLCLYRPVLAVAHAKGLVDFLRGKKSWDKYARNGRRTHAAGSQRI